MNNFVLILVVLSILAIANVIHSTIQLENVYSYLYSTNSTTLMTTKTKAPEKVAKSLPEEL